ncbi:MAG: elongation factor P [Candidatus Omnitrophica bacterium CG1_02_49_16]|nr:MAG: elongation factor P [Candidatus Omnitrophica bacterium CG1_02_49_16]
MISTSQFKAGVIIKYNNELCEIIDFQLVKMQQRQPIVSTKLKNIKTGNLLEQKFRSGDKFEDVFLEDKPVQYLYREGTKYHFMDSETYQDVVVNAELLGDRANFLKENSEAVGRYWGEELLSIELPSSVVLKVIETEPGVRGDTAKSGTKPSKVETGATIKVPLFVNSGDQIRVDTRTGQYLERA